MMLMYRFIYVIIVNLVACMLTFNTETKVDYHTVDASLQVFEMAGRDDFFYTYGDDMDPEDLEYAADFFTYLPNTLNKFIGEGGRVIMSNEQFADVVDAYSNISYDGGTQGFYFRDSKNDKKPTICLNYYVYTRTDIASIFAQGETEIHELAHYMDDLYGFSGTEEFRKYFKNYAEDYKPNCSVIKGYQTTSEKEFFAILVCDIVTSCDIENLNLPEELFDYMNNVFMTAEGISL